MLGDLAKKIFHSLIANEICDLNCIFFFFLEFRLDYPVNVSIYNFKTLYFCKKIFIVYLCFATSSSYAALLLISDVALFTIPHPRKSL